MKISQLPNYSQLLVNGGQGETSPGGNAGTAFSKVSCSFLPAALDA